MTVPVNGICQPLSGVCQKPNQLSELLLTTFQNIAVHSSYFLTYCILLLQTSCEYP